MAESDLLQQLDQAVDAMLRGRTAPPAGPEVSALLRLARHVRSLPDAEFRRKLRFNLMSTPAAVSWIPAGFHSVTPYLHVPREASMMDFLKNAFGAEENFRVPGPGGAIMHAQLRIGDSIVELAEVPADLVSPKATSFRIFVQDTDETYRRAIESGATTLSEPVDKPYGYREAGIKDPAGNYWFISRAVGASYKTAGSLDVEPSLIAQNAPALIDFLQTAFGAEVTERHEDPAGAVRYASVRIGDSTISMGEARDQWQPMPGGLHYYVANVDAVYQRALQAGARSIQSPVDKEYGDRYAGVIDPSGNYWYLTTHIKDVRPS